jgi:hypothetical protein
VTRICFKFVNIPAYDPDVKPEGAFENHTMMKSNA